MKLINRLPYSLVCAALAFLVFGGFILFFLRPMIHNDLWWLQIATAFGPALLCFVLANHQLRSFGLDYFATMGEFAEAFDKKRSRVQSLHER